MYFRQILSSRLRESLQWKISLYYPRKRATTNWKVRERFFTVDRRDIALNKGKYYFTIMPVSCADREMDTDNDILVRRVRSILTQLKSNTSEATDDNCKDSSPMSWSCRIWPRFDQLLSTVDQWLVDITASNANIRTNEVFQYPSERQPALPVNPSVYGLKGRRKVFHRGKASRQNENIVL